MSTGGTPASGRDLPGVLSLTSVMSLPVGSYIDVVGVRGYHLDMRVKTPAPVWPPDWLSPPAERLWVVSVQYALGAWERYVAGEGEQWRDVARAAADDLLATQGADGAWRHGFAYPHTFRLAAGWPSAITQGEAASLLVRIHETTGEERYADGARRALMPLDVPASEGGCLARLDGRPFPEEYPTSPGSYVLNGALFAIWGRRDVAVALGDEDQRRAWEDAVEMLRATLHHWDLGWWSRYDLFPHVLPNVASSFYHHLHVAQLRATARLTGEAWPDVTADRWEGYARSRPNAARAFAQKVAFRLAVPRNPVLARRAPWCRA